MKLVLGMVLLSTLASCGKSELILVDGIDGYSIVVNSGKLSANVACPSGGTVTTMYQDIDRDNQVTVGVDKLQSTFITCNGLVGKQGILSVINLRQDVCGQSSSNFSEVIIKLTDGRYLSSFSDNVYGDNTRFTILVKNIVYKTTDGNNCKFKINDNNVLVKIL
jgi:hypothetical protein